MLQYLAESKVSGNLGVKCSSERCEMAPSFPETFDSAKYCSVHPRWKTAVPRGLGVSEGVPRLLKYRSSGSNVVEELWRGELRVRLAIFNRQRESKIRWLVLMVTLAGFL